MHGILKIWMTLTLVVLSAFASPVSAEKIGGIEIADTLMVDGKVLTLNGAGIRTKFFMDIYVGSLYLTEPSSDADAIIALDKPAALRLHMVSGLVTSEKMSNATEEGFEKSRSALKIDSSQISRKQIDELISVFKRKINKGDVYDLVYLPSKGVQVSKNGEVITVLGDLTFKKVLFGIWLSDKPAHKKLKQGMLGKS